METGVELRATHEHGAADDGGRQRGARLLVPPLFVLQPPHLVSVGSEPRGQLQQPPEPVAEVPGAVRGRPVRVLFLRLERWTTLELDLGLPVRQEPAAPPAVGEGPEAVDREDGALRPHHPEPAERLGGGPGGGRRRLQRRVLRAEQDRGLPGLEADLHRVRDLDE